MLRRVLAVILVASGAFAGGSEGAVQVSVSDLGAFSTPFLLAGGRHERSSRELLPYWSHSRIRITAAPHPDGSGQATIGPFSGYLPQFPADQPIQWFLADTSRPSETPRLVVAGIYTDAVLGVDVVTDRVRRARMGVNSFDLLLTHTSYSRADGPPDPMRLVAGLWVHLVAGRTIWLPGGCARPAVGLPDCRPAARPPRSHNPWPVGSVFRSLPHRVKKLRGSIRIDRRSGALCLARGNARPTEACWSRRRFRGSPPAAPLLIGVSNEPRKSNRVIALITRSDVGTVSVASGRRKPRYLRATRFMVITVPLLAARLSVYDKRGRPIARYRVPAARPTADRHIARAT